MRIIFIEIGCKVYEFELFCAGNEKKQNNTFIQKQYQNFTYQFIYLHYKVYSFENCVFIKHNIMQSMFATKRYFYSKELFYRFFGSPRLSLVAICGFIIIQ